VWTLSLLAALTLAFPAAAADPLTVSAFTDKATYERGEQALLTVQVKNTSLLPVSISFSNGQKYDFTARDANGAALWTWSYGKTFGGSSSQTLAAGATLTYQETWTFVDNAGAAQPDGVFSITGSFLGQYIGRSGAKEATQAIELVTPDPLVATFSTDKSSYSRLSSSAAQMTLTITNVAAYAVTIDFQTAQQVDFAARNASGQVVWTWSNGKVFDQDPQQLVLAPGESLTYTGSWSLKTNSGANAADGNYILSGTFLGTAFGVVPPKGGEKQIRLTTLF
jgi:uncharacterized protein affecting Mg2+/Co2+ transport